MRSRAEEMRIRKAKRRQRLAVINICLLFAIIAVLAWNGLLAGKSGDHAEQQPGAGNVAEGSAGQEQGTDDQGSNGQATAGQETANEDQPTEEIGNEAQGDTVRLAFVGDILLGENVGVLLKRNGYDYPYLNVKSMLQEADVTAGNLETAVAATGEKAGAKQYEYRSPPEALPALRDAGFDVVSLANNHTLDFGPEGLRETIRHLKDNEISYIGAGENADEAYEPAYFEKNGITIAYIGLSRVVPTVDWKAGKNKIGVAETYDYRRPVEAIKAAKEKADFVVVMVHWGNERELEADPKKQTELGHRYIDAGADLVIGAHPHVLQGIESYNNKWIAYSMGNFVFTRSKEPLTYDSAILFATCEKEGGCKLQLVPVKVDTSQPTPMEPDAAAKVLERVESVSINARIGTDGSVHPLGDSSAAEESTP